MWIYFLWCGLRDFPTKIICVFLASFYSTRPVYSIIPNFITPTLSVQLSWISSCAVLHFSIIFVSYFLGLSRISIIHTVFIYFERHHTCQDIKSPNDISNGERNYCHVYGSVHDFEKGSGLDDWIYWHLIHTTRDYRRYSAITDLHTLQHR
jgi:hypothetical protein